MGWLMMSVLLAGSAGQLGSDDERPSLIVLDFSYSSEIDAGTATTLTGLATASLAKNRQVRIVSGSELAELMELEGEKAALGCVDDGCLAEIAGALGARFAVSGRIAKLGDVLVLQMRLMDVPRAESLSRVVRNAGGLETFVTEMDAAAVELLEPAVARIEDEARARGEPAAVSEPVAPVETTTEDVESHSSAPPAPPEERHNTARRATRSTTVDEAEESSWLLSGSLIGGGLGLIALGVLSTAIITPVDVYLAFVVHPPLGLEDAIAPAVYLGAAVAIAAGVGLVFSPLFLGDDDEGAATETRGTP